MKKSQTGTNPFKNSNTNKRYFTYDHYLKSTFGGKAAKIPLDCGFTCPNIDGSKGYGGCIYCSDRGSGDFAMSPSISLSEQYYTVFEQLKKKWHTNMAIAYFQAHSNTYASTEILRNVYYQALSFDGVVGINIATRADCLSDDTVELLCEIAERTTLTVELGLQSVHDKTAALINRCHTYDEFVKGFSKLRNACDKIGICIHLIEGLPGEDHRMMMETATEVSKLRPDQVKIHSLNILSNTRLERLYLSGEYTPITREEYVRIVCDSLEVFHEDTVIGRLTGDADRNKLTAPLWTLKKTEVLNEIDKTLYERNTYQGIKFVP